MDVNHFYICPVSEIDTTELLDFAKTNHPSSREIRAEALQSLIESGKYGLQQKEIAQYFGGHLLACKPCQQEYKYHEEVVAIVSEAAITAARMNAKNKRKNIETILRILTDLEED